ncbi:hypothetical protein FO440_14630 [Mucilaginibacter corticis]|uniref:Uncharacterized protein n=1 Tax=Mucilaginibacter corticis TaxID=2597670 RepID=A0A556MM12_9SPHI|nr:hypothetical protein [Mucilaginibacter corticis]TSJ40967.1 hypothetical protein FO440_14630 [Mucilaginibacter corticis]
MTDLQRFNLYWLCQAMTVPTHSAAHYYYDSRTKKFFSEQGSGLLDMINLLLLEPQKTDLETRLAHIDSEASEIVEFPRLNQKDKVSVQLLFLSNFPGIMQEENLRLAAEKQPDAPGFVLDDLEAMNPAFAPMLPYWEDFKLQTIQYYLEQFTGIIGITLKMVN